MEILNLVQGSEDWLDARINCFCASEAPAMMGASKYWTREQLLDSKKGKKRLPVSDFLQSLFDRGHWAEQSAREILSESLCEDIAPVVLTEEVEGMSLLASLDGRYENGCLWEHKLWNETLAENILNGLFEPEYYWQMEHQLLVSGAKFVAFDVSDGTTVNRASAGYTSVPERRKALIDGWKRFAEDLKTHTLTPVKEVVVVDKIESLPVVRYQVSGSEIDSNIADCLLAAKYRLKRELENPPTSENDYAERDKLNKLVKKARVDLKATVSQVRERFLSFNKFSETAEEIDSALQKLQSDGEKLVKARKQEIKGAVFAKAREEFSQYLSTFGKDIQPLFIGDFFSDTYFQPEIAAKGQKTLSGVNTALALYLRSAKAEVKKLLDKVSENVKYINDYYSDYWFLFKTEAFEYRLDDFQTLAKHLVSEDKEKLRIAADEESDRRRILDEGILSREKLNLERAKHIARPVVPLDIQEEVVLWVCCPKPLVDGIVSHLKTKYAINRNKRNITIIGEPPCLAEE